MDTMDIVLIQQATEGGDQPRGDGRADPGAAPTLVAIALVAVGFAGWVGMRVLAKKFGW